MATSNNSTWHHIQRDFSGGEISPRMLMRTDTDAYNKSVQLMSNFIPTQQGGVERAPGTSFVQEIPDLNARIIPYLSQSNDRTLLIFTPNSVKMLSNAGSGIGQGARNRSTGTILDNEDILPNGRFKKGLKDWDIEPEEYYSAKNNEGPLGCWLNGRNLIMTCRTYKEPTDFEYAKASTVAEVKTPTTVLVLRYNARYRDQYANTDSGYTFKIVLRVDDENGAVLKTISLKGEPGTEWGDTINIETPSPNWTGSLWLGVELTSMATDNDKYSHPVVVLEDLTLIANVEREVGELDETTPYTAEELKDLQFVQSPYGPSQDLDYTGYKELIVVHPNHQPRKLWLSSGAFRFEVINYGANTPAQWTAGNYPKAVTSFMGRLIYAGSNDGPVAPGAIITSATETIWGTEVGRWLKFSDNDEVNPDDSIELTTTYRSPIQWVYGHKTLLTGALEYEYVVSADGIFSPGDLGVDVHSTHGSKSVQPMGMGQGVLFASDNGKKCRAMTYSNDDAGWVAAEVSLLVPELIGVGIRRMVRMRNPHQMAVCLLENGRLAIFHQESEIAGWSRYQINGGVIEDVCVVANSDGEDVLYLTVARTVKGEKKLYLEAITDWTFSKEWNHLGSSISKRLNNSNELTGLGHLEGKIVQAAADGVFLGSFKVKDGRILLVDQLGSPIDAKLVVAGLAEPCKLITLPPLKNDPGAKERFSQFSLRLLGSSLPIVNGERPSERKPVRPMNLSQDVATFVDIDITKLGWETTQFMTIEETTPLRVSVLGIYGRLTGNSL